MYMPEQALDGIPLALGLVIKIVLLNFHMHNVHVYIRHMHMHMCILHALHMHVHLLIYVWHVYTLSIQAIVIFPIASTVCGVCWCVTKLMFMLPPFC